MSKQLVTVFGATGAQGGSVVDHLLKAGKFSVRAVTRSAAAEKAQALKARGVEIVEADVSKPETLPAAFKGAWGAFVVTNFWDPSSMGKELDQGKKLADAAKTAGVEFFQWSSLANVEKESNNKFHVPHFTDKAKVEDYARSLGFKYTAFPAAAFYYQNFQSFFPPKVDAATNTATYALPAVPITMFDVSETGAWVVAAFLNPEKWNGKFIPMSGDHLTAEEAVRVIGQVKGQKAVYYPLSLEDLAKGSKEMSEMFAWFGEYTYYGRLAQRENSIRANPTAKTLEEYLKASK